ncbi:MAG: protein arginine kinase [Clostridiales bacterium]|nr:protein arginine kinase [Clostridiales bacterium]
MEKWYIEKGDQGDIVLSTRIRLARNLREYPFPSKLSLEDRRAVNELIKDAAMAEGNPEKFSYIEMDALTRPQAVSLAERHLVSPEFASSVEGRALLLTPDESVSIMLCEEDHIRLQVMKAGLALNEAFEAADAIDSKLDAKLKYAFDERIGYLTQCPTNLGTAMRASLMLHLPALTRLGHISRLSTSVSKLGMTMRGAYGEGSEPKGDIYQLSNQITLGITEAAALENLNSIAAQLVGREREAAKLMLEKPESADKVWRALGVLQTARLLSGDEFMELISLVRLGAANGMIDIELEKLNELIVSMQPATLNAREEQNLTPSQRDSLRALAVREVLGIRF